MKHLLGFALILSSLAVSSPLRAAQERPDLDGLSSGQALRLGERMYRTGILPSGEPMRAVVQGDISVDGTAFTCASCHLRSGLGSYEGTIASPPINGASLFQPLAVLYKGIAVKSAPPRRSAYTEQSLAEVLRSGVDPSGRALSRVMPRYVLRDEDMALLIAYLKSLSAQLSPGVSDSTLHFATVVTQDVSPADVAAMMLPLEKYIASKNNMAAVYETDPRSSRMAESMAGSMALPYLRLSLSRWVLKGPATTWREQLEEHYHREPVFALLGGITTGGWAPIHEFSEAHQIPCLFPITDLPVVSDRDWYTLYFSKGYYQEGETAARYLSHQEGASPVKRIVQIVRDSPQGQALASGFEQTWHALGQPRPRTITLQAGESLSTASLEAVLARERPELLVLWAGEEVLPALGALFDREHRPQKVMLSGTYLSRALWTLDERLRELLYLTYPYRLPQDEERHKIHLPLLGNPGALDDRHHILKRSYLTTLVLTQALLDMRGSYYRDNFLDVIGMIRDREFPLYERLSFGPGQRYAAKGCYIVQLSKGREPRLVTRSEWVMQ